MTNVGRIGGREGEGGGGPHSMNMWEGGWERFCHRRMSKDENNKRIMDAGCTHKYSLKGVGFLDLLLLGKDKIGANLVSIHRCSVCVNHCT